jgi:hypothetical protein
MQYTQLSNAIEMREGSGRYTIHSDHAHCDTRNGFVAWQIWLCFVLYFVHNTRY